MKSLTLPKPTRFMLNIWHRKKSPILGDFFCLFYLLTNARVQLPRTLFLSRWQFQQFFLRIFVQFAILIFPIMCGILLLSDGDRLARKVRGCFGVSLHPAEGVQGGSIPPISTKKIFQKRY